MQYEKIYATRNNLQTMRTEDNNHDKRFNTSEATRVKWSGICGRCITDAERFEIMLDMNADIKNRIEAQR